MHLCLKTFQCALAMYTVTQCVVFRVPVPTIIECMPPRFQRTSTDPLPCRSPHRIPCGYGPNPHVTSADRVWQSASGQWAEPLPVISRVEHPLCGTAQQHRCVVQRHECELNGARCFGVELCACMCATSRSFEIIELKAAVKLVETPFLPSSCL